MVRRRDIKKSDFIAVEDSEASDYFDFVRNGQNLKIRQDDLASFFGVSGAIAVRGETSATPVLRIIGGINYIRNILGGPGVKVQTSAQDGVLIGHNFTVDDEGVPIMINSGADSPTLRSIQAGGGINVAGAGGIIQISSADVPASNKTILVFDIGDFPAPVGGVITLAADTEYKLQNDVSSANRYEFGNNTVLSAADDQLITLEYTGIGTMITTSDVNVKIKNIILTCTNATLFSFTSSTGYHETRIYNSKFTCNNAGSFNNLGLIYMFDCSFNNIFTQGMIFTGHVGVALFHTLGGTMSAGTGTFLVLGSATFDYFHIYIGLLVISTTGYVMSGLTASGNITVGGLGLVTASRNFGTTDPPMLNISPFDNRWEFQHNSKVEDSYDVALSTRASSLIAIATPVTPVIVGATWTSQKAYRFTATVGGRWTYTGKGSNVTITASITADLATGTDSISFFVYKNGIQIPNSRVTREFTAGSPGNLSLLWETNVATNDYLELWVQNDDTNVDITVITAVMRIRS